MNPSIPDTPSPQEIEWQQVVDSTPAECRRIVAETVAKHGNALADFFYRGMLDYPKAAAFLNHEIVHKRLHKSMVRWLQEIYSFPMLEATVLVAHQRHVGDVHARIQLPLHLVARGARLLKYELFRALAHSFAAPELHLQALSYAGQLMDLALELMSEAFQRSSERGTRTDEAYRLFTVGQNMSVERERQRSVLLEWGQEVLFSLHRSTTEVQLTDLGASDFGMWFNHKAAAMFEGAPEVEVIHEIMVRVDTTLLPQLQSTQIPAIARRDLIIELQTELENLKFQLATLFERQVEVENGRDTLTRLLNRRFLPSVMSREIRIAGANHTGFALLLLDLDHFKRINDEHGHEAGDMVLQQAATLILNIVRNGDFVFRYGGEEILLMLVEVDKDIALRIAENIRDRFESNEFTIGQGRTLHATVSIGLALFDGHPDHQYLIRKADEAMYQAKNSGRNQVRSAD